VRQKKAQSPSIRQTGERDRFASVSSLWTLRVRLDKAPSQCTYLTLFFSHLYISLFHLLYHIHHILYASVLYISSVYIERYTFIFCIYIQSPSFIQYFSTWKPTIPMTAGVIRFSSTIFWLHNHWILSPNQSQLSRLNRGIGSNSHYQYSLWASSPSHPLAA
jgi:hypothetical protein